jgi:hypothetical protein
MLAILMAGCAASAGPGSHAGEPYIVTSPQSLFYLYGPAQSSGPDFALSKGQAVTMLSRDYGYSHVALQPTGQTGYVATEELAPAPPPVPQPSPSASPAGGRHRHHAAGGPMPIPAEGSQIPLPEFPESKPPADAPPFRY